MTGQDCLNRYSTVSYLRFGRIMLWIGKVYSKYKSFYFLPAAGNYTFFRISAAVPVSFGFSQMRPAPASLPWRRCGGFAVPLEKTVMFLTVLKGHNSAVFSGLSDERSRRKSLREEFWLRWQNFASPGQLEIPRF